MRKSDFDYFLPPELIAQSPAQPRGAGRLLEIDADAVRDRQFSDLPQLLRAGDLLVFNDTRVIPARIFGTKRGTGGRVEVFIERILSDRRALVQMHASKSSKPGTELTLEGDTPARVLGRREEFFELEFELRPSESLFDLFERIGHVPLPPYIRRADIETDKNNYQTIFAREPGAVAAPTAGLHFSEAMLEQLRAMQVEVGYVTLHVGAGTFQPMRVEEVEGHRLHAEHIHVGTDICSRIDTAKREGRRVIAVGTTVVRALESAAHTGALQPFDGETEIFIYPGYTFRVVDALITNFHLPQSTLLMLVCAFAGTERVLAAYGHAVERGYRFFSYGDAVFCARSRAIVDS